MFETFFTTFLQHFTPIIKLTDLITLSVSVFLLGVWGTFVLRRNIIIIIISIELMLLAVNLNLVFFSLALDDILPQALSLLILTVAAAESAIGLALLVIFYRLRGSIEVDFVALLKG